MPWWWGIVTTLFGSGGAFTVIWFAFTRRINKADAQQAEERAEAARVAQAERDEAARAAQAERAEAERLAEERAKINESEWLLQKDYRQKQGRALFWIITEMEGIMDSCGHKPVNGHLKAAWARYEEAEANLKAFEDARAASLHRE